MAITALYDGSPPPRFRGVPCRQQQSDLDWYADLIWELQPPWLFQAGIWEGGTMAFLAEVMHEARPDSRCLFADADLTKCRVSTSSLPNSETYMADAVTTPALARVVTEFAAGELGLVSLGDAPSGPQRAAELELFAHLASYLVVEGAVHDWDAPFSVRAVLSEWLPQHPEFTQDADPEVTQHPGGWLRRVA